MKSFHDDEALVTAHEEGKGKYYNMVGSLVCISRTGAIFKVGSGLTDSMRSKVRKSYIYMYIYLCIHCIYIQINNYSIFFFSYIYIYLYIYIYIHTQFKIKRHLHQHQVP